MTRPLCLCDFDGVLNPVPFMPGMVQYDWTFEPTETVRGFQVNVSLPMGRALRAAPMDLEWLTTWCRHPDRGDDANRDLAPLLGWPDLPQHREIPDREGGVWTWWKQRIFESIRAEQPDRPIVWIDDDHPEGLGVHLDPDGLTLRVCPASDVGLTRGELTQIHLWATSLDTRAAAGTVLE